MSNDNKGLLSTLLNISKDMIIVLSEHYKVIEINATFKKFFPDDIKIRGENFLEYCKNKQIPLTQHECGLLIAGIQIDKEHRLSNDKAYYFSWEKHIINDNGPENTILFIAKDSTDLKHISFLNKQNQTQLERISSVVPGNFYWKNLAGEYLGCNASLLTMLGMHSVNDIIGKNDCDLWPDQAHEIRNHDKEVMFSQKTVNTEESIKIAGKTMFFTVIKMPLLGENDQVIGILGNSLDITNQKNMEQELRNAKIAAEAGEKSKTEFIENVSHDMRTPLSGIIHVAHDLEENELKEAERKELSTQLAEAGDALLEMFEEILEDVAAEHMTENDIKLEIFDINRLLDRLI